MIIVNRRGVFEYSYTQIRRKKIFYATKTYAPNGLRERQRRIKQMMKAKR